MTQPRMFSTKLFAGRLFAGRLFRNPVAQGTDAPGLPGRFVPRERARRRHRDEEALLFMTVLRP